MRPVLVVILVTLLVAAGCSGGPSDNDTPDPPPPGTVSPFLADAEGDADSPFDLLNVTFFNLNGSFVVRIGIDRVAPGQPFPFYNATIHVDRNEGGKLTLFAAAVFDPNRSAPGVRPLSGVVLADGQRAWQACQAARSTLPSIIFHEVLAEEADLKGGGVVTHVEFEVSNHTGSVKDTGSADGAFPVRGGVNPYKPPGAQGSGADCPLFRDPSSPQRMGG